MRSICLQILILCLILAVVFSLTTTKIYNKSGHKIHPHEKQSVHKTVPKLKPNHHAKLRPTGQLHLEAENDFDFEVSAEPSGVNEAITLIKTVESEIGEVVGRMSKFTEELESAKKDLEKVQSQGPKIATEVKEEKREAKLEDDDDQKVVVAETQEKNSEDNFEAKEEAKEEIKAEEKEEKEEAKEEEKEEVKTESNNESNVENNEVASESKGEDEAESNNAAAVSSESESKNDELAENKSEEKNEVPAADDSQKLEEEDTNDSSNSEKEAVSETVSSEDASFLQISTPDEMNSVDDDDSSAPVLMAMKRHQTVLAQKGSGTKMSDAGFTFGATTDGTLRTFDISDDGDIIYPPPPTAEDEFTKSIGKRGADAKDRFLPPMNSTEAGDDSNVVCVCKRQGAPRGFDRIRCKRNPKPSPSPTPIPRVHTGIKQCANGTWAAGADKGTKDVICIYFPADEIKVTPPTPPEPEPQYPAECYDDRNEWVAEGVEQKGRDKLVDIQLLIQSGYESCGC